VFPTINVSRNHRTGALVTATAVAVAVTGALSFGRSDTPELVIARPAAAIGTDGNSIRGPGIPPALLTAGLVPVAREFSVASRLGSCGSVL
jgi:hypothetical protein